MILKMFSKLDSILCLERKRESKKASFLIRDILDEGEDEEVVVADEEDFHVHPPGPTLLSLPQGALWDAQVVPYPHPDDLLAPRAHRATGFSLCCLNCPPQSWHTGFPADLLSPQAAGTGGSPGAQPGWSAGAAAEGKAAESGAGKAGAARKVRRNRTVFTELQLMGLERRFDCQKYLSTPDRAELARALGLTQLQVKTWYQNRRMKWKKQVMQGGCTVPPTKPKGRPKKNSIPSLNETRAANELAALKEAF